MPNHMHPDGQLEDQFERHHIGDRTESSAMLAWFLVNVWGLDEAEVPDNICDGNNDKGIDAIVLDDDASEIVIFQAKRHLSDTKGQGDNDLKHFHGVRPHLASGASVDKLLESGPNNELKKLLSRLQIRAAIDSGSFTQRYVFVTNGVPDRNANTYLEALRTTDTPIDMWDRSRMEPLARSTSVTPLVSGDHVIRLLGAPTTTVVGTGTELTVGLARVKDLAELPGIADTSLFARNVRYFIGKTSVNKDLEKAIRDTSQHAYFSAYHNGFTLITNGADWNSGEKTITLHGAGVVNGCQSLTTIYDNRDVLTDDLTALVKIISGADDAVSEQVTYRSNNQNSVTLRDQRSSDPILRTLQARVTEALGPEIALQIRVGEKHTSATVLDNALVAQWIMAVVLEEPWAAVRKVRLFDTEFRRIFNRTIGPWEVLALYLIDKAVSDARSELRDDLRSSFASARFTLDYLVAAVVKQSELGSGFFRDPEKWLFKSDKRAEVSASLGEVAREAARSLSYHVDYEAKQDDEYDPKTIFKSKGGVEKVWADVKRDADRSAFKGDSYLFEVEPSTK